MSECQPEKIDLDGIIKFKTRPNLCRIFVSSGKIKHPSARAQCGNVNESLKWVWMRARHFMSARLFVWFHTYTKTVSISPSTSKKESNARNETLLYSYILCFTTFCISRVTRQPSAASGAPRFRRCCSVKCLSGRSSRSKNRHQPLNPFSPKYV